MLDLSCNYAMMRSVVQQSAGFASSCCMQAQTGQHNHLSVSNSSTENSSHKAPSTQSTEGSYDQAAKSINQCYISAGSLVEWSL